MNGRRNVVILFVVCIAGLWTCSRDSWSDPEPLGTFSAQALDSLLLDQFRQKNIVLLGDPYEYHRSYLETVTDFLDFWLDRVSVKSPDTLVPRHLALALDADPQAIPVIKNFVGNGDRRELMRGLFALELQQSHRTFYPTTPSVDYFEFLDHLRHLRPRDPSLNRGVSPDITLDIISANGEVPSAEDNAQRWNPIDSRQRIARWRSRERGEQSVKRIAGYLRDHPDARMILFYDSQQLFRADPSTYYSIVHGLDSLLGRDAIAVFRTTRLSRHPLSVDNPGVDRATAIEEFSKTGDEPDFILRREPKPPFPFPFNVVRSQNTLNATLDIVEQRNASSDTADASVAREQFSRLLGQLARSELCLKPDQVREIQSLNSRTASLTKGRRLSRNDLAVARRLITRFDAVKDIIDVDKVIGKHQSNLPTEYLSSIITVMGNLPPDSVDQLFTNRSPDEQLVPSLADWGIKWRRRKVEITAYMLTQLLWIGTPKEVEDAMGALRFITKFDYRTPDEWSRWWYAMTN